MTLHPEHLQHFVAEVVDHFDGDPPGGGGRERARRSGIEARPSVLVDLISQRRLQRLVRIISAEEVGLADEEAFLVIIAVDEPARDASGVIRADLAGGGSNTSMPCTFTRISPSGSSISSMSGSPNRTNRLPRPVLRSSPAICRSGFMRAFRMGSGRAGLVLRRGRHRRRHRRSARRSERRLLRGRRR
jgi:hypothetical protein